MVESTVGWFDVREKYYSLTDKSWLISRIRPSEHVDVSFSRIFLPGFIPADHTMHVVDYVILSLQLETPINASSVISHYSKFFAHPIQWQHLLPCSLELLQQYFSVNKQCFPLTTNQYKHQHKPICILLE